MSRRFEQGVSTESLIVAVGRSFTDRKAEADLEYAKGQIPEEKAFWLAFGTATLNLDLATQQEPAFDLAPATRCTLNYFNEKHHGYFLSWLTKITAKQVSGDRVVSQGAARLLQEAKRRRIYPPRRR